MTIKAPFQKEGSSSSLPAYYLTLLRVDWEGRDEKERRKLRRKEPLLVAAIEGILDNE